MPPPPADAGAAAQQQQPVAGAPLPKKRRNTYSICSNCLRSRKDGPGKWLNGHQHAKTCPNASATVAARKLHKASERRKQRANDAKR